jgi:alpha/beta superfamily hydrolase
MIARISSPLRTNAAQLRSVDLIGPAGKLEAVVNEGDSDAPFAALVCHPHPLGGGSLHNKVVYHAMKVLNATQWANRLPVLRFNFRGTGLSQGTHDGEAESGDVLAALKWLQNEYRRPIVAAGFSFGAAMMLKACCGLTRPGILIRALVALGLPIQSKDRDYSYPCLARCMHPKLFLSGDHDQFAPARLLEQVAESASEPKHLAFVPGADHFFTGHLEPMQHALSGWLKEQLI